MPIPMKLSVTFLLSLFLYTAIAPAQFSGPQKLSEAHFTGKVFRKDGEKTIPAAGVIIESEILIRGMNDTYSLQTVSDENGNFTLNALGRTSNPAVIAKTDDLSFVGIGRLVNEGEPVEIELVPAASFQGRLLHPDTGQPLTGMQIAILLTGLQEPVYQCMQGLATDDEGRFFIKGLFPGKPYLFILNLPEGKERAGFAFIGLFLALESEKFDVGDITVDDLSPNRGTNFLLKPFRQEESATTRFEKAKEQSRESKKPILVLLIHAESHAEAISDNPGFLNWFQYVIRGLQAQKYLAGYEYVPVDVTNPQASELAEKLGVKLPEKNTFTIVVCDSEGKQITRRDSANFDAPRFKPDGELLVEFNPVLLLTFLKKFGK